MELVDRYLDAVRRYLPKAQQDDIIAELSDDIESAMETREAELGHPLDLNEQAAILARYGRPVAAAGRYRKHQYLIGPELFPYYLNTLKIVLLVVLALDLAGATLQALTSVNHVERFFITWGSMWNSLLWAIGVVTVIFAIRERVPADWPSGAWDPRKLPPVRAERPVSRTSAIVEAVFNVAFLSWLLDVPGVRHAVWYGMTGPASDSAIPFALTPAWHPILVALIAIAVATIAQDCINLIRPEWTRLRAWTLAVTNALIVIVIYFVLQAQPLIVPADGVKNLATYQEGAATLNTAAYSTLLVWAVIAALIALFNVRALLRRPGRAAPTTPSVAVL
jgi:hypothetical protein